MALSTSEVPSMLRRTVPPGHQTRDDCPGQRARPRSNAGPEQPLVVEVAIVGTGVEDRQIGQAGEGGRKYLYSQQDDYAGDDEAELPRRRVPLHDDDRKDESRGDET